MLFTIRPFVPRNALYCLFCSAYTVGGTLQYLACAQGGQSYIYTYT